MNHARLFMAICGLCTLLLGCVSAIPPDRQEESQATFISGVVIRNKLPYPVTDVLIEVPATGNFAGCGNIQPLSACSNTFQRLDYRHNAVMIRWKEHGQPQQTDEFRIQLPDDGRLGASFLIEVIVFAPGQAGAHLVDAEPETISDR